MAKPNSYRRRKKRLLFLQLIFKHNIYFKTIYIYFKKWFYNNKFCKGSIAYLHVHFYVHYF